ncbi:MAG: hypothetical protein HY671_10875 [Chloroflexi bacterium]|nr:hypothetical protein [Chloroflexota bacterium]
MSDRDRDKDFERSLKLRKYEFLLNLSFNEDRLIGERSRSFLIANGLLLTGFGLARTPLFWIALATVGSILGYFWIEVGRRNIIAIRYWWSRLYMMEADEEFQDHLQIYTERARYYGGQPMELPLGKFPSWMLPQPLGEKGLFAHFPWRWVRSVNWVMAVYLPALFTILWLVLLTLSTVAPRLLGATGF